MPQKTGLVPDVWSEIDRIATPTSAPIDVWSDIDKALTVSARPSYGAMADRLKAPAPLAVPSDILPSGHGQIRPMMPAPGQPLAAGGATPQDIAAQVTRQRAVVPPGPSIDEMAEAKRAKSPIPVTPRRLGSAKTGGAAVEPPIGEGIFDQPGMAISDATAGGLLQMGEGAGKISAALTDTTAPPVSTAPMRRSRTGALYQPPPSVDPRVVGGAADIVEGGMAASTPLLVGGLAAAPVETGLALAKGYAASKVAETVADEAGLSPEATRLVAATAAGVAAGVPLRETIDQAVWSVADKTRKMADAAEARRNPPPTVIPPEATDIPVAPERSRLEADTMGRGAPPPDVWTAVDHVVGPTEPRLAQTPPTPAPPAAVRPGVSTAVGPESKAPEPPPAPPAVVPATGIDESLGPHAYAGPERRQATAAAPPEGVERRRVADEPIDATNPTAAAQRMLEENPRIIKEAAELGQRARDSRMEAPPREALKVEDDRAQIDPRAEGWISEGMDPKRLTIHERRELGRMLKELDSVQFTKKTFSEPAVGKGGSPEVTGGAAGAPVFDDIGGTGTREDIAEAIRGVLAGKLVRGKVSANGNRAIQVARERIAGSSTLSRPMLPKEAGNEAGVTYVDETPDLTKDEHAIEQPFRQAVENRTNEMVALYRKRFGNVVDSDKFKELSAGYAQSHESRAKYNRAVHRASSAGAAAVYRTLVQEPTPEGKQPIVSWIAGPTGAGKDTVINTPLFAETLQDSQVVLNGPMTRLGSAEQRIQFALDHGKKVDILYVHRDPVEAWHGGVVPRGAREGRLTPLDYHVQSHVEGLNTIRQLADRYADEPRVSIEYVLSKAGEPYRTMSASELPKAYNEADVRSAIEAAGHATAAGSTGEEGPHPTGASSAPAEGAGRPVPEARPADHPDEPPTEVASPDPWRQVDDVLDTGEVQTRLPGAESARQVGKADTTFKAPQQASGDDFKLGAEETPEAKSRREAAERGPDIFDQIDLPPAIAAEIRKMAASIPDSELAEDGREDKPHVTVKFGLHTNEAAAVRRVLAGEKPITVAFGKVSIFPAKEGAEYDVVKVDVDSPDLHRLNAKIAGALENTETHPTYKPHATIAYVKAGLGKKYVGRRDLEDQTATLHAITFSGKDRQKVSIPLTGKALIPVTPKASSVAPDDETPGIQAAIEAWRSGRAYIDGRGNYHVRASAGVDSGPIAPWNAEAKKRFADVSDLHKAAQASQPSAATPKPPIPVRPKKKPGGHGGGVASMPIPQRKPATPVDYFERRFGSDEAMSVRDSDEGAVFEDGTPAAVCTNCAFQVVKTLGRGKIVGFGEDAIGRIAKHTGGHDFALVDDRYIVDPWIKNTEMMLDRVAFDLSDPADARIVEEYYGPRRQWETLEAATREARNAYAPKVQSEDKTYSSYSDAQAAVKANQQITSVTVSGGPKRFIIEDVPARKSKGGGVLFNTGPYRGLPPPPKSSVPVTERMRPSAIIAKLQKGLGDIPVNIGRFRQQALGIYKQGPQAVRLRVANDLQTLAHEIGHHVDHAVLGINYKDARWRDELQKMGQPTSRPSYSVKQQRQEGAAEFFRNYLIEPATAKADAPNYHAEFERLLDGHPDVKKLLLEAREDLAGLIAQDPATRGRLRIDFTGTDSDSIYQRLKEDPKGSMHALATAWIDDLHALRVAVDEMADARPIDARANAYILARNARGTGGMAEGMLEHGVRGRNGRFLSGGFADAITPVKHHLEDFASYLVARRVLEVKTLKGKETGMSAEEARAIITEIEAGPQAEAMQRAADNVYAYQQGLLQYAKEYRVLSDDQYKKLLTEAHYVPLQRVMDAVGGAFTSGGAKKLANRTSPIKRMKGSGRDIINPLESIIRNTFTIVDTVEKKRAMHALVVQANKSAGSAKWLEKVPAPQVATQFNLSQIETTVRQELEDAGVDLPEDFDLDALVKVFTPAQFAMPGQNLVTDLHDGKREFYEVHDQALYDAITAIGGHASSTLIEWASKPAALLRAGATLTPGFIARNPTRDTLVAFMQSRYGFIPVYDTVRGFLSLVMGDEHAKLFLTSGVQQSSMVGADRDRIRKKIREMSIATRAEFFRSMIFHPVDLLRALSENMESATRLGEFRLARNAAGQERRAGVLGITQRLTTRNRPKSNDETLTKAALAARDVTTDFSRAGTISREANRVYAFFNARIQGYIRMAETAERDPTGTVLNVSLLALLSAALWWMHEDDDEYNELPDWEKNSYWHIPTGKGYFKVAKPFEWAYLANVTEAALSHVKQKDPDALNRIKPGDPKGLVFALMPSALTPVLEAGFNYDTFRDSPIVKPWDIGLDPSLQRSEWTTDTAVQIGKLLNISPAKVDHIIFGYGAGFARGVVEHGTDPALAMAGLVRPKKAEDPAKKWQRVPVAGTFYREGAFDSSSQSLKDFYTEYEKVVSGQRSAVRLAKTDAVSAKEFMADASNARWRTRGEIIKAGKKALEDLGDEVNAIYAAPPSKATPQQKREALDKVYRQMVDVARRALGKAPLKAPIPVTPRSSATSAYRSPVGVK